MKISVLTPDRTVLSGDITSVQLPGVEGSFQLLENHAPLVSALGTGNVQIVTRGEYRVYNAEEKTMDAASGARTINFTISRGFVEVLNNEVNLLVQSARNLR